MKMIQICGLRVLNKVKGTDINFKVEIWFDIKEDTFSENHFKTKEEQDDLLALLKKKFLETINASYEEVKGTDPITKVVGISDIKFENHSSNHENTQKGHKKMGGGDRKYNDGKDRDRNRKWA